MRPFAGLVCGRKIERFVLIELLFPVQEEKEEERVLNMRWLCIVWTDFYRMCVRVLILGLNENVRFLY